MAREREADRQRGIREVLKRRPPNLRMAEDQKACANCRHFDGKGTCKLYSYPVRANEVCDSYAPRGGRNA